MAFEDSERMFEALPVEIWNLVIEFLRWDSWSSLHALNLTCRALHQAVSPVLFRIVHIQFPRQFRKAPIRSGFPKHLDDTRFQRQLQERTTLTQFQRQFPTLCKDDTLNQKLLSAVEQGHGISIFPHVRILIISYGLAYRDEYLKAIGKLVESLPNLKTIRWRQVPFHPDLSAQLGSRQIPAEFYYEGSPGNLLANDLVAAPYIISLSLTFRRGQAGDSHKEQKALRELLVSLPSIRRLALKYHPGSQGGSIPIFELQAGDTLPSALRDISLTNFSFGSDQSDRWAQALAGCSGLRRLSLDGGVDIGGLIYSLSAAGDLRGLHAFSIRICENTSSATAIPPGLRKSVDEILCQILELTEFVAYDLPKDVLHRAVQYHGNTLRHLRFRRTSHRLRGDNSGGCLFRPQELEDLSRQLPHLERLGIDMCFTGTMPINHLDSIALFPCLKFVELNTPPPHRTPSRDPWHDGSMAQEVFSYLAGRKSARHKEGRATITVAPFSRLKQVDIKEGEWEPLLRYYNYRWLNELCIYTCWDEVDGQGSRVHALRLPCTSDGIPSCVDDNMYERTMLSAGLGSSDLVDLGPEGMGGW